MSSQDLSAHNGVVKSKGDEKKGGVERSKRAEKSKAVEKSRIKKGRKEKKAKESKEGKENDKVKTSSKGRVLIPKKRLAESTTDTSSQDDTRTLPKYALKRTTDNVIIDFEMEEQRLKAKHAKLTTKKPICPENPNGTKQQALRSPLESIHISENLSADENIAHLVQSANSEETEGVEKDLPATYSAKVLLRLESKVDDLLAEVKQVREDNKALLKQNTEMQQKIDMLQHLVEPIPQDVASLAQENKKNRDGTNNKLPDRFPLATLEAFDEMESDDCADDREGLYRYLSQLGATERRAFCFMSMSKAMTDELVTNFVYKKSGKRRSLEETKIIQVIYNVARACQSFEGPNNMAELYSDMKEVMRSTKQRYKAKKKTTTEELISESEEQVDADGENAAENGTDSDDERNSSADGSQSDNNSASVATEDSGNDSADDE